MVPSILPVHPSHQGTISQGILFPSATLTHDQQLFAQSADGCIAISDGQQLILQPRAGPSRRVHGTQDVPITSLHWSPPSSNQTSVLAVVSGATVAFRPAESAAAASPQLCTISVASCPIKALTWHPEQAGVLAIITRVRTCSILYHTTATDHPRCLQRTHVHYCPANPHALPARCTHNILTPVHIPYAHCSMKSS